MKVLPTFFARILEPLTRSTRCEDFREFRSKFNPGEAGGFADIVFGEVWFELKIDLQRRRNEGGSRAGACEWAREYARSAGIRQPGGGEFGLPDTAVAESEIEATLEDSSGVAK